MESLKNDLSVEKKSAIQELTEKAMSGDESTPIAALGDSQVESASKKTDSEKEPDAQKIS